MNKRKTVWIAKYRETEEIARAVSQISSENNISEICASLLYNRGYKDASAARSFLSFNDTVMHSSLLLKDVEPAVCRIQRALEEGEKIAIYGDYDVDGVTSVTMLYTYLHDLGADVGYYIPNRAAEGYGVSKDAVAHLAQLGVSLIITVDTGITAVDETEYARELGIDMVITDHHECQERIPDAVAVIDPHRSDCPYPFKSLAGVGVIFKVICAFETLNFYGRENEAEAVRAIYYRFADLAAIGTIADVMPLTDENRIIVKFGLSMIEKTKRPGLLALMEAASAGSNPNVRPVVPQRAQRTSRPRKINSTYIGFTIAPRINAAGRISSASRAVELLLSEDIEQAAPLAQELCEINYTRQLEENRIAESAYKKIEKELDLSKQKVIVVSDDEWMQGVVGIVSSKVTEKYGLPSILITFDGASEGVPSGLDVGRGSGRSIRGFNLVDALSYSKDTLVKFGGHELAAGLSVRRKDLDLFREKINEYADLMLTEDDLCLRIEADRELKMSDLSLGLAKELSCLEPFGNSNPTPNFMICSLNVRRADLIGGGNHTRFTLESGGVTVGAVMFHRSYLNLGIKENDVVDVLCTLDVNNFNNTESLQLIVQDIRLSESYLSYFESEDRLYRDVIGGASFSDSDILPTRDDFVAVYSLLRREFRVGNDVMSENELFHKLSSNSDHKIRLAKLKIILAILDELKICTVEEIDSGIYRYDIYKNSEKKDIESSCLLGELRSRFVTN